MMSLSSSNKRLGRRSLQVTSKAVREERLIDEDADPCKKTCKRTSITDLPDDCLNLVYKRLYSGVEHSSFGLVCRHWLDIQNNNHESLWNFTNSGKGLRELQDIISPESFTKILCRLLIRFQHLKRLSLSGLPEVTDYITSQSQLFRSKVQFLCLMYWPEFSNQKLSLIFSSFPCLASIRLSHSRITDKELEVLAKYCASLEIVDLQNCQRITDKGLEVLAKHFASLQTVNLGNCRWITDKGLEFLAKSCASLETIDLRSCQGITDSGIFTLIQNCSKLYSLAISHCTSVTGTGFLGCPKTLTKVYALKVRKLTTEGIKSIASGGGLQSLYLSGDAINNETVISISKSCPLLKVLYLKSCHELQLEGWKAISLYCTSLKILFVETLCGEGLKALCEGCKKLSWLSVDSWNELDRELFKRERPDVYLL